MTDETVASDKTKICEVDYAFGQRYGVVSTIWKIPLPKRSRRACPFAREMAHIQIGLHSRF
jgi:hypothetical protein